MLGRSNSQHIDLKDLPISAASYLEHYCQKCVYHNQKEAADRVSCDVVRIDLVCLQHGRTTGENAGWKNPGKRGGNKVEIKIVQLKTAAGWLVVPRQERTLLVYISLPLTPEYPTQELVVTLTIGWSEPRSRYPSLSVVGNILKSLTAYGGENRRATRSTTTGVDGGQHVADMDRSARSKREVVHLASYLIFGLVHCLAWP